MSEREPVVELSFRCGLMPVCLGAEQGAGELLVECQARGIKVHNAGIFASGLLVGGSTYKYGPAPPHIVERTQQWAKLAHDYNTTVRVREWRQLVSCPRRGTSSWGQYRIGKWPIKRHLRTIRPQSRGVKSKLELGACRRMELSTVVLSSSRGAAMTMNPLS